MDNINLRIADENDAPELLKIYEPYVLYTTVSFEITVPTLEEFKKRIINTLKRYPYIIAETNKKIIGYCYASQFKPRAAYDYAIETSIYIDMDYRGKGIGKILYEKLFDILKKQNVTNVNSCIAYPNPQSIEFHNKLGFKEVAHFTKCGYKLGNWVDMIWMEKMLGEHPENPLPFICFKDLNNNI